MEGEAHSVVARRFLLLVGLFLGAAAAAQSQSSPDSTHKTSNGSAASTAPAAARDTVHPADIVRDSVSRWETSVWGGVARGSPELGFLGTSYGMNLGLVGIRFARPQRKWTEGHTQYAWTVDLIPYAIISPPAISDPSRSCPGGRVCVKPDRGGDTKAWFPAGSVKGLGIIPLGVTATLKPGRPVSPTLGLSGGALYFTDRIPSTGGARFNYIASAELGMLISPRTLPQFMLEYRFVHISNAGSAENLGVASHLVTIGLGRRRSRPAA